MQSFDIYFAGETLPDADPQRVRHGLARLFKIPEDKVERLFSGKPLRVKHAVDVDTAGRYRATFREIGALIQIVPTGAAPPLTQGSQAAPPAPRPVAAPPPANNAMQLAPPGAILDESQPPPAVTIDTGHLSALAPNSGSLEDCRIAKVPRPIPDISHLRLLED